MRPTMRRNEGIRRVPTLSDADTEALLRATEGSEFEGLTLLVLLTRRPASEIVSWRYAEVVPVVGSLADYFAQRGVPREGSPVFPALSKLPVHLLENTVQGLNGKWV